MTAYPLASLITLLVVALMFATSINVGRCRVAYKIMAPATTGHEMFDRAYRIQMNTIEAALMMLPSLWLFAVWDSDHWAGVIGGVWVLARIWYAVAYWRNPASRSAGFGLSSLAFLALWGGAFHGAANALLH